MYCFFLKFIKISTKQITPKIIISNKPSMQFILNGFTLKSKHFFSKIILIEIKQMNKMFIENFKNKFKIVFIFCISIKTQKKLVTTKINKQK